MIQLSLWSVPPLLAALVTVGALLRVAGRRQVPGVWPIMALFSAVLFWSACEFAGSLVADNGLKTLFAQLAYLGIATTPVAWFIFAITFPSRKLRPPAVATTIASVVPLLTLAIAFTNGWHGLHWRTVDTVVVDGYAGLVVERGPWFYIHAGYSYVLIVIATSILGFSFSQNQTSLKSFFAVVSAPLIVGAANVFSLSPLNPLPWFDITTLGFALACLIIKNGVLDSGMLDTVPVVRDRVVQNLKDGIVVVNHRGQIIDVNPAALALFAKRREQIANRHIDEFVTTLPLMSLTTRNTNRAEITLNENAYDVTCSRLDLRNDHADLAFVFRDVTERRKADKTLRTVKTELERLAHTDGLTGLFNRRLFIQRMHQEAERVRRHGGTLSVLLYDLDHFKRVNDTYGHEAGDKVLSAVGKISNKVKRVTDVAARIGGEEFAMLLPETDERGAFLLAERLRKSIADMDTTKLGCQRFKVSTSIGVATVTRDHQHLDNVLNEADRALYRAKHKGRNQVCMA